jgi:predicted amidohydrolase/ribulose-5-phosphate 4-epimerase/fuculose-1-phosphate aldolase
MQLKEIPLGAKKQIKEEVNVHLMQIEVPRTKFSDFFEKEYQTQQAKIVEDKLNELTISKKENTGDIIIFPELSVPNSHKLYLKEFAKREGAFIVAGFFYNDQSQNKCYIFAPNGEIYEQPKLNPAPDREDKKVHNAHEQLKKELKVFVDTPVGDFAVLVCYDFTDIALLVELKGKIDHLIIPSLNKSVERFDTDAIAFARENYYYISICNIAEYGGSAIYGPSIRQPHVGYTDSGETILPGKIKLKELRSAMGAKIKKYKDSGFCGLPAGYERDLRWWDKNPIEELEDAFIGWENLRNELIEMAEGTVDRFNLNKNKFARSIEVAEDYLKKENSPRTQQIIQLAYLLEDLKKQSEAMTFLNQFIKSSRFFRTGGNKFTDLDDIKYDFLSWTSFLNKYNLEESEIKNLLNEVATYCRKSCENYDELKCGYNVVSKRIDKKEEVILSTRTNVDKRKITADDVVLVSYDKVENKDDREIVHYCCTNISNDKEIRPSQETHLNYEIHRNVPRAKTILHFHHDNVLELAWSMPLDYKKDKIERYDELKIPEHPTPTLNGRNVKIKEFAERMVEKFNENEEIYCIIGVRHGAWAIAEDFETCLKYMKKAEKNAGINKSPKTGEEFLNSIKNDVMDLIL